MQQPMFLQDRRFWLLKEPVSHYEGTIFIGQKSLFCGVVYKKLRVNILDCE